MHFSRPWRNRPEGWYSSSRATRRAGCRRRSEAAAERWRCPPPSSQEALAWLRTKTESALAARLLELAGGAPLTASDLGLRHDEAALAALHAKTTALLGGATDPIEVAEHWRKTGDGQLVMSALFAALRAIARRGAADPDRLYAAVDDVVETCRQWLEVPGLGEQLVYEGLALRCAGAAAA